MEVAKVQHYYSLISVSYMKICYQRCSCDHFTYIICIFRNPFFYFKNHDVKLVLYYLSSDFLLRIHQVEVIRVHGAPGYLVTASRDNTWYFYDISEGSCLMQVCTLH
jgi:hypothetical protein